MVAPMGIVPFVRPFAHVIMSGTTPHFSAAKDAPRRPNPVITSSKMSRMPCLSQISRRRWRYPLGGGSTPVEPATGSTMTAAIVEASWMLMMRRSSSAKCAPFLGLAAAEGLGREIVGRGQVVHVRKEIPVGDAMLRDPADGNAAESHAVIGAFAADEAHPRSLAVRAMVGERDLERRIDGFGPGIAEEHVVEALRRQRRHAIGAFERDRMAQLEGRRIVERAHLRRDRVRDALASRARHSRTTAPPCRRGSRGRHRSCSTCPWRRRRGADSS
jgi:hypothetical protein